MDPDIRYWSEQDQVFFTLGIETRIRPDHPLQPFKKRIDACLEAMTKRSPPHTAGWVDLMEIHTRLRCKGWADWMELNCGEVMSVAEGEFDLIAWFENLLRAENIKGNSCDDTREMDQRLAVQIGRRRRLRNRLAEVFTEVAT